MLIEANETFLKKDKALVGRSLVQASKNVIVRVMNPAADTQIIYPHCSTFLLLVCPLPLLRHLGVYEVVVLLDVQTI
jgi:hypothetical protein